MLGRRIADINKYHDAIKAQDDIPDPLQDSDLEKSDGAYRILKQLNCDNNYRGLPLNVAQSLTAPQKYDIEWTTEKYDPKMANIALKFLDFEEEFQTYLKDLLKKAVEGKPYFDPPMHCEYKKKSLWGKILRKFELSTDIDERFELDAMVTRSRLLYDIATDLRKQGSDLSEMFAETVPRSKILYDLVLQKFEKSPGSWQTQKPLSGVLLMEAGLLEEIWERKLVKLRAGEHERWSAYRCRVVESPWKHFEHIKALEWVLFQSTIKTTPFFRPYSRHCYSLPDPLETISRRSLYTLDTRIINMKRYLAKNQHVHHNQIDPAIESLAAHKRLFPQRFSLSGKKGGQVLFYLLTVPVFGAFAIMKFV